MSRVGDPGPFGQFTLAEAKSGAYRAQLFSNFQAHDYSCLLK
jgi:hypothetical protein